MAEAPCAWPRGWGAPRLLTRAQVRAYLQVDDGELQARMSRGLREPRERIGGYPPCGCRPPPHSQT